MHGTMKHKVLLLGDPKDREPERYKEFCENFQIIPYELTTRHQLIKDFKGKLSDIEAIFETWMAFGSIGGLNDELIEAIPDSLKIITVPTVGFDHCDADALKKKGVILNNSPDMSSDAVADLALLLTLSAIRYTSLFEHSLREHRNTVEARTALLQFEPEEGTLPTTKDKGRSSSQAKGQQGKTAPFNFGHKAGPFVVRAPSSMRAGILGLGHIGRSIASRLSMIGMGIHAFDKRHVQEESQQGKTDYVNGTPVKWHNSVEELAKHSDVLVLALPLHEDTHHIVDDHVISVMPPGSKIVNIGRGPLIDEKALIKALKSGHISSAGLDVYEDEPEISSELAGRYNVTVLPHLGGSYAESVDQAMINCMDSIEDVLLHGGKGKHPVNVN